MSNPCANDACECAWHRAMRGLESSRLPQNAQHARATAAALALAYRDIPEGAALLEEILASDWNPSCPSTVNTIHKCLDTPPPTASKLAEQAARIRQHIATRVTAVNSIATEDLMRAALADLERLQNAYQSDDDLFGFLHSEA